MLRDLLHTRRAQAVVAAAAVALVVGTSIPRAQGGATTGRHWLRGVAVSEYWPAPESWFGGPRVHAPGIPGVHSAAWLYSGTGMLMEGDGVAANGARFHVSSFGTNRWVNRAGRPTVPTASGGWTHGDPAWAASRRGVRFAAGPSQPLRYWNSVAVDPHVIPFGSRIYIPAYRHVNGGWFVATDTGSAIIGRHIDVFRPPPANANAGGFLSSQRVLVVPPAKR